MKNVVKTLVRSTIFIVALAAFSITLFAQEGTSDYDNAKKEITATFGTFPSFFDAFPQYALPGAWQSFKELQGPGTIDKKNRELIGLGVASQIPCTYCVYFHTESAKAFGATAEEIKEAVAFGALVRHWSTVLHGAQVSLDEFKKVNFDLFNTFPEYARAGAKRAFNELRDPGNINEKNRELIGLAVSSQIPCTYCVWSHSDRFKNLGGTDEEIKEAVAYGALVRHWSTVIHGAQTDFNEFKKEFDGILKYMLAQANAK